MNYIPFVLEKTSQGERSFDIYSRLLQDRIILLIGEITDQTSSLIISQLLYLDSISETEDIYMYISSPGGSITAGMAIYDTMKFIHAKVITICVGMAMSMAAFLLASGTKKRYSLEHAEIMIHQPQGGMQGQVSDLKIQAKRLINTKNKMNALLAELTKHDIKQIAFDTERDYYMDAKEALAYGIIDEIISKRI